MNLSHEESNEKEEPNENSSGDEIKVQHTEDFEEFKKQFNFKEVLDKLIIKREFFIPSKAIDINRFYIIEKELGEGAYGKVYLGTHKKTGKS